MAEQNGEVKKATAGPAGGRGRGGIMPKIPTPSPSTSAGISTRLPSFRGPRDLTLSASCALPTVKPSLMTRTRKTFSPNIPVRREKVDKLPESQPNKSHRKRNQDRGKREGGRGRGRGKEREYVQTAGSLFGEGIAAINHPRHLARGGGYGGRGGGGGGGAGSEAGYLHKPVLNLDAVNNYDQDHEDQKLKEILRDDFIDDDVMSRTEADEFFPVQLPMVNTGRVFKEEDSEGKAESSMGPLADTVKVKSEPTEDEEAATTSMGVSGAPAEVKDIKPEKKVYMKGGLPTKEKLPEPSVTQLLTGKHEDLMFFQLPHCLPSLPPEIKQEPSTSRSQPQQQQQQQQQQKDASNPGPSEEEDKKPTRQYCTLRTLPEGQIGTLKVYKSGKTELWLGEHRLLVNKGTQVGFLQDVVSIDANEETKTGTMTVLGHIGHRLVCSPDLESLVKQIWPSTSLHPHPNN